MTNAAELEALKDVFKEELKSSVFHLSRYLGYDDVNWHTHGELIRSLERETKKKLIVMPRGTFKSTITSVAWPIWLLINNPNLRILIDSEVYTNSKNFLREIRWQLEQEALTDLFGEFKSDNWSEGELTIKQRTKGFKEASITAGGIGTIKVGQHYDVIIMDDLNSQNNSETTEGRQKVIRHYQMNRAILEPEGIVAVVGTRYAVDDVIGHVMANEIEMKEPAE